MNLSLLAAGFEPLIPFAIFFVFTGLSILHALSKRNQRGSRREEGGWGELTQQPSEWTEKEREAVVRRYIRPELNPAAPSSAQGGATSPAAPPPLTPRTRSPWEIELDRVLRGEPASPSEPTTAPTVPSAPLTQDTWMHPSHHRTVEELTEANLTAAPMPTEDIATLEPADDAYANAASLNQRVQDFMHSVDRRVDHAAPAKATRREPMSPELAAFVAGLRQPSSVRQALLASFVFAPPKALE